jgi:hypothetical protein
VLRCPSSIADTPTSRPARGKELASHMVDLGEEASASTPQELDPRLFEWEGGGALNLRSSSSGSSSRDDSSGPGTRTHVL